MTDNLVEEYGDRIDQLFCRRNAPFGGYSRIGAPTIVVPDLLFRATLQQAGDGHESDRYELTVFEGIDGFAGELWQRSAKSMLRLRALNHPGLPEIVRAQPRHADRIAFTLTREVGPPLDIEQAVAKATEEPIWAFEQFSILLDALKELHVRRILHRGLVPDAFRADFGDDMGRTVGIRLARFEMSTLISNIMRRVSGDATDARRIIRRLHLAATDDSDTVADRMRHARHMAYLAPEMHAFVFDEQLRSRRDWQSTDTFGLGVLGWELFCGGLGATLPDELAAVAAATGADRVAALTELHLAMRRSLKNRQSLPEPLREMLGSMLGAEPDERPTTFELSVGIEQGWDAIRAIWEKPPEKPYLVAFMPDESTDTIYNTRGWISRNPREAEGREELREFFARELKGAFLLHSPTGARGYVTGNRTAALADAEWVLIGERGVWFCAYLRELGVNGPGRRFDNVLVIKFVRSKEEAQRLARMLPRRRVPDIEPVSFRPGQSVDHLRVERPPWTPLTESVQQRRNKDAKNEAFLQSMDFLLDYQRTELAAHAYPFVGAGGRDVVEVTWDRKREDDYLLRRPLLNAYSQDVSRRPSLADFVNQLDVSDGDAGGGNRILLAIDSNPDRPSFSPGNTVIAQFVQSLDQDTIRLRPLHGASLPAVGWLRPNSDSGTPVQLSRQLSARRQLEVNPSLVRALRDPPQIDLGRHRWQVESGPRLSGNAPAVIRDMLSREEIYALQGPPGSGKTHTLAHAVDLYLKDDPGNRVLVSAQSNQALDNIAKNLIKTLPADTLILREMARNGDLDRVDPLIQRYTLQEQTKNLVAEVSTTLRRRLSGPDHDRDPLSDVEHRILVRWLQIVESNQIEITERLRAAAAIVLATCSIAATVLDDARDPNSAFDWVVLEEAAKAWPTEIIIPLVLGTRWTLVGDHRQLGAHRGEEVGRFLEDLERSSDERVWPYLDLKDDHLRLLNLFRSLFESGAAEGRNTALGRLDTQFRMHDDIVQPIARAFYPLHDPSHPQALDEHGLPRSFLKTHESANRPHGMTVPGFLRGHPLIWLDTEGCADCTDTPWWSNDGEVDLIERLVSAMEPKSAGPGVEGDRSLVVLTPYRAQLDKLQQRGVLARRVHTVHSFQGGQADRVVVSLVRSTRRGDHPAGNVGHVGQDEVANVLLSRAQRLLIVVGNLGHFERNAGPKWSIIAGAVRQYGHVQSATKWAAR
ncbi:AAA domain-containing protein [Nocardia sp. alder85J]|uniref:AAA domain-containing protein n=1 Tax=Nocardia sp. alder85J TaxID=2862949 RepID=UPI001CD1B830|nr:AAA domain-containing protein [Nocardia sp. alder85J]MCX4094963.1 AAA domain-containing protein [Nocardia sp. alder85J]